MPKLEEILEYNRAFVENKEYEQYRTDKFPNKRMVILTCMDTRLIELLPKALNLSNGDAKLIKNAGAVVSHPFGSVMRSIIVSIYELQAEEVLVIGHHDCGMTGLNPEEVMNKAVKRGINPGIVSTLRNAGIDLSQWLCGFERVQESVLKSVEVIRNHPLLPANVPVHGLVIHPETGKLDRITE